MIAKTRKASRGAPARAPHHGTRERLLEVAARVFGERGYRDTTVREICRRAKANVAAINYHFGDKDGLYRAVIAEAIQTAGRHDPSALESMSDPEEEFRRFVHVFVERLLNSEYSDRHAKIMAREMVDPTPVLDDVVRDVIRPTFDRLRCIVANILGVGLDDPGREDFLRRTTQCIIGQALIHRHCHAVMERLRSDEGRDAGSIRALAEHIADFSLSALRGLRVSRSKGGRR